MVSRIIARAMLISTVGAPCPPVLRSATLRSLLYLGTKVSILRAIASKPCSDGHDTSGCMPSMRCKKVVPDLGRPQQTKTDPPSLFPIAQSCDAASNSFIPAPCKFPRSDPCQTWASATARTMGKHRRMTAWYYTIAPAPMLREMTVTGMCGASLKVPLPPV